MPLFYNLREKEIGACGTTRINEVEYSATQEEKSLLEWNSIDGCRVGFPSNEVFCFLLGTELIEG